MHTSLQAGHKSKSQAVSYKYLILLYKILIIIYIPYSNIIVHLLLTHITNMIFNSFFKNQFMFLRTLNLIINKIKKFKLNI